MCEYWHHRVSRTAWRRSQRHYLSGVPKMKVNRATCSRVKCQQSEVSQLALRSLADQTSFANNQNLTRPTTQVRTPTNQPPRNTHHPQTRQPPKSASHTGWTTHRSVSYRRRSATRSTSTHCPTPSALWTSRGARHPRSSSHSCAAKCESKPTNRR